MNGIIEMVRMAYPYALQSSPSRQKAITRSIDESLESQLQSFSDAVVRAGERLYRVSWRLSLVGEAESVARAMAKFHAFKMPVTQPVERKEWKQRVELAFSRIRRRVVEAVEIALILEQDLDGALARVRRVMPQARRVKRPKRSLKPILEAKGPEKFSLSVTTVTDEEWEEVLDLYKTEYVPRWRSPDKPFDKPIDELEGEERYAWEVEQDMTHDFVTAVRQGKVEAANQLGIKDFVWIAVIDDRTDECCDWRDGLLASEIRRQLNGKHRGDECQVDVPPAHFNCRCTLAPALKDLPDAPASNLEDFEEWLDN
jgi:SPP1 gp7 family putative phage head morphogenesis protein